MARKLKRIQGISRRLAAWAKGCEGAVSPMMALLLIPLVAVASLAAEAGYWGMAQRTMQHASDSAAIAAAGNNDATLQSGVERYKLEASAVAKRYPIGSTDTAISTIKTDCPGSASGTNDCYKVTITRNVPFYLAGIVGFSGNGSGKEHLTATAYAKQRGLSEFFCAVALGANSKGFGIDLSGGGSSVHFDTCYGESAGQVKCAGKGTDFKIVWAPSEQGATCSGYENQDATDVTDPYKTFSANLPDKTAVGCSSATSYSGLSWTTPTGSDTAFARICSGSSLLKITTGKTGTGGSATCPSSQCALIVDNATFNLNNNSLSLSNTTLIFTNSGGTTMPTWIDDNKGTLSVTAPTAGTYGKYGFAILDDPSITSPTDYNAKFANVNFAGIIYAKNRNLSFNGSVDTSVTNEYCTTIVAKSLVSNGGKMATTDCKALGYTPPATPLVREVLVK